jgi:hypothetical protein
LVRRAALVIRHRFAKGLRKGAFLLAKRERNHFLTTIFGGSLTLAADIAASKARI